MPFYKIEYRLGADTGHRFWILGEHPNDDGALMHFNSTAGQKEGIALAFDSPDVPFMGDYFLVEMVRRAPYGLEPVNRFALHKV